ncbi:protein-L-isoaspartate O-methyltransferase family protein [Oceanomicrobium pacificus]|uniref:Protein-L-isoaspartate O-methyltransferase n=1 Tax=Oceanomicrobium pacificus TaxID=2692916 RepID=A0A6B0TN89_9RHOB|nr:protein-L-isoaspartate O-methyltransferase [Oceanomicrobium pacificus]MXU66070.1 methyltransferase domain-containing protein [Oceanomicrobium pacificus]
MTDFAAARTAMVDTQVRPSDVTQYPIIEAMLAVPREDFVPNAKRAVAYMGEHVDLGNGRFLLDPRVMGKMLSAASVAPDDLVLDIGCATGYSTALLARMAEAVVGVEEDEAMARSAEETLSELGADNAVVQTGPLIEGDAANGPYDVILIQGGVEQVPAAILDQLKEDGRIVAIHLQDAGGRCDLGIKANGRVAWRRAFDATAPRLPGFEKPQTFEF